MLDETYYFRGQIRSDPSGHKSLIEFYYYYKDKRDLRVLLDFFHVGWIDANLSALLDAILFYLKQENNHEFFVDAEVILKKFDVLCRNGFVVDFDGQPLAIDDRDSTAPLSKFYSDQDTEFITYIEDDLLDHRGLTSHQELKMNLIDHFAELFANIETHAKTNLPIFVCGQYYPKYREFKFTIVDLGVGFLEPIAKHTNGRIKTCKEAITWALKGNTTKLDASGGLGLPRIYQYCSENRGCFNIITGDAYWGNNLGASDTFTVPPFLGTTIHLTFKC